MGLRFLEHLRNDGDPWSGCEANQSDGLCHCKKTVQRHPHGIHTFLDLAGNEGGAATGVFKTAPPTLISNHQ